MYESGGDGTAAVPANTRQANVTTSPSRRSPSAAVLSSSSPTGTASAPATLGLASTRGVPLSPPDGPTHTTATSNMNLTDATAGAAFAPSSAAAMYAQTGPSPALCDEELDMFDIELQRDFQSKLTPPAAAPSAANMSSVSPPLAGLGGLGSQLFTGRVCAPRAAHGYSPWTPHMATAEMAGKQFASLADMCQTSNFLERRDDAQRLMQRIATTIRKEMHVALDHGVLVTVTGTGSNANTTTAVAGGVSSDAPSPAGTPVLPPSTAGPVSIGVAPRSFEQDIQLVNFVVSEVNRRYANMLPSPSSPRVTVSGPVAVLGTSGASTLAASTMVATTASGGAAAAPSTATAAREASSRSGGRRPAAAAASPTSTTTTTTRGQSHTHRSSLSLLQQQQQMQMQMQMQARRDYTSGRSTIDTEVNDSLGRIHGSSERNLLPHHSHFQPSTVGSPQLHDPVPRPGNPYPASAIAGHAHSRSSAAPHQGSFPAECPRVSLMHGREASTVGPRGAMGAKPGSITRAAPAVAAAAVAASEHWDTRSNQSTATTARSEAGVQCPRAVKPPTASTAAKTTGPRNRTGKNIVPSDRSAFSECSGGETRSSFHSQMNSTFRHNHSSSTCRTADTSMSSAVPVMVTPAPLSSVAAAGGRPVTVTGPGNVAVTVVSAKDE